MRSVRRLSVVVFAVLLVVTVAGSLGVRLLVGSQEHRLLRERTAEVGLVFTEAVAAIPTTLAQLGADVGPGGSPAAFQRDGEAQSAADRNELTFALLRPVPGGFVVIEAVGSGLRAGQSVTGPRAAAMATALTSSAMVVTRVLGSGSGRLLGFALGPPAAPAGTVLYRQSALGVVSAPRQADTAPFSELDVALYATSSVERDQVLVATSAHLPLAHAVDERIAVGQGSWLLVASARRPLVGGVSSQAWLWVLGAGILGSVILTALTESIGRRRDSALALYAAEHELAETLQRSLLPDLPQLVGLDLAARYLAAGAGQQVGGDWFDVFALDDGHVGIAIGDVMGHDIAAAAAMAQVRATLRSAAWREAQPGAVLEEVDQVVTHFGLSQLVTVIYAVLAPPASDGSRLLTYANAGHLPPIGLNPSGGAVTLTDGASVLLGAPVPIEHGQATFTLMPGGYLVLFTDGLVETPGRSLDEGLGEVASVIRARADTETAEAMCQYIVDARRDFTGRDDLAVLVVRLPVVVQSPAAAGTQAGAQSISTLPTNVVVHRSAGATTGVLTGADGATVTLRGAVPGQGVVEGAVGSFDSLRHEAALPAADAKVR